MRDYYVLSSWVNACRQGFRFSGFDDSAMMAYAGLSEECFSAPYCESRDLFALFRAAQSLNGPTVGLESRHGIAPTCFSSVSLACLASPNLEDGLSLMAKYHAIITNGYHCRLDIYQNGGVFRFFLDPDLELPDSVADAVIATVVRTVRFVQPRIQSLVKIDLARPRPAETEAYSRYFKVPVDWGTQEYAVHLSAESLRAPSMHGHPELLVQHLEDCNKKLQMVSSRSLVNSARHQIRLLLSHNGVSIESVASALGTSARSLQRALQKENTTFKALSDDVRKLEAQYFLKHTSHSVTHIAHSLGFSDAGNFARAFKRWCRCSPQQYRQISIQSEKFREKYGTYRSPFKYWRQMIQN